MKPDWFYETKERLTLYESATQDIKPVINILKDRQDELCHALESFDQCSFEEDSWSHTSGGGGRTRVIENGTLIEKGGVNFSHVSGTSLPQAATKKRPEIAGQPFQAAGISTVIHPDNPFIPTAHMNVRIFSSKNTNGDDVWWFGGGFDLTPYYGFVEDVVKWHAIAKELCDEFAPGRYDVYKKWCDEYFYINHRNEARGVGGIFFDDLNDRPFNECLEFIESVLRGFSEAYCSIIEKRKDIPFTQKHKSFQRYRRGRYVEFNLVYDRGTLFGLQSKGRTESILMSMPPQVDWKYDYHPAPDSEEAKLYTQFLPVKNWLDGSY